MTEATARPSLGTAVVTGASGGIGRVYADRLARRGHDLLLVARRGDLLDQAAAELRSAYGVQVRTLVADLGGAQGRAATAAQLASDASITMLVNNAGSATLAPIANTSVAQADSMLQVNVVALTELTQAALPGFLARDRGVIVNIGSVLGFASIPVSAVYSGTKAFVHLFTRALQNELVGTNVRAQLVLPSSTATDIWATAGRPLADPLAPNIMRVDDCVDAALAGLDAGEPVTLPSVEKLELLEEFDSVRVRLLHSSQHGKPASRYKIAIAD